MKDDDHLPKFVPHDCRLCSKRGLIGPHYLSHLRFKHPVEYELWISSRASFGMSTALHVMVRNGPDNTERT